MRKLLTARSQQLSFQTTQVGGWGIELTWAFMVVQVSKEELHGDNDVYPRYVFELKLQSENKDILSKQINFLKERIWFI